MEVKKELDNKTDPKKYRFRKSPEFKLKDKQGRTYVVINLRDFGFLPETIIIQKTHGQANKFTVVALLTPEEIKKDDERNAKLKAEAERKLKVIKNLKEETKNDKPSNK